jgi:GNAT superfamily N-acetyltransferase
MQSSSRRPTATACGPASTTTSTRSSACCSRGDVRVAGLAHVRAFARPLAASAGGFLDDLYIEAGARRAGGAVALMAALRQLGAQRGWTVICWITAEDNHRAQRAYDPQAAQQGVELGGQRRAPRS